MRGACTCSQLGPVPGATSARPCTWSPSCAAHTRPWLPVMPLAFGQPLSGPSEVRQAHPGTHGHEFSTGVMRMRRLESLGLAMLRHREEQHSC